MQSQISFCTTAHGVRIAYSTTGCGRTIIWTMVPFKDLQSVEQLARCYLDKFVLYNIRLIQWDRWGAGLSDRNRADFSLEGDIECLEAIVANLKLDRFILYGQQEGGLISMAYAARHPEHVSHLILEDAFARGEDVVTKEMLSALLSMVSAHWGAASRTIIDLKFPHADTAFIESLAKISRESTSVQNAVKFMEADYKADITAMLPAISAPTLVMHSKKSRGVAFKAGRRLATLISGSIFAPMEGDQSFPFCKDWEKRIHAIDNFLGSQVPAGSPDKSVQPVAANPAVGPGGPETEEARSLIAALDHVSISRYCVVGKFTMYDEAARNALKDAYLKIAAGFNHSGQKRENHIIWAAPGSGKTYFVQQAAASLPSAHYHELNLAKCNREEFLSGLGQLDSDHKPCICLIDEVDAKSQEIWPYEILLPYLDASVERAAPYVFVLVGSSGFNLAAIKKLIASRPKGTDLLSRIPAENEYEIPSLTLGDRVLVVLSQFRLSAQELGRDVQAVEKLGLYYITLNSRLTNARQLRELAVRTIERLPAGEDRVKYDHLFGAGDPENKAFWIKMLPKTEELVNRFVIIEN